MWKRLLCRIFNHQLVLMVWPELSMWHLWCKRCGQRDPWQKHVRYWS